MARKPNPDPAPHGDTMNTEALDDGSKALTELSKRSADIVERFGDGLPYERIRVMSETRFFMAQAAESILQVGRRLILLKEHEPHGEWQGIVTSELKMNLRTAQVAMQTAAKFLSPQLASKANTYSLLGVSKLLDLTAEPDDELVQLAEGGTLAGHTIDEIQAMSVKELRAALAEARKANAAKDKVIQSKSTKLDKLEEQLAARETAPLEEQEAEQLNALRAATEAAEQALQHLAVTVDDAMNMPASDAIAMAARQTLDYIAQRLADAASQRGLVLNFEDQVLPAQVKAIRDSIAAKNAASKAAGKRKGA